MNAETNQVARPARRYAVMAPTIRPTMAPPIISRAAMQVAVLITGDDVAKCETEAATAGKSCGRQAQGRYELLQQAHVRDSARGRLNLRNS